MSNVENMLVDLFDLEFELLGPLRLHDLLYFWQLLFRLFLPLSLVIQSRLQQLLSLDSPHMIYYFIILSTTITNIIDIIEQLEWKMGRSNKE